MTRQIVFTLNENEALNALKAHYRSHALTMKTIVKLVLLWLACIIVMSGVLMAVGGQNWIEAWGIALVKISVIYAFIIVAIWALNYFILLPRRAYRLVKGDRQIGLEQTWIWDDQAVAIRSSYIKGTYPFRLFYDWREYPTFLALYISNQKFNVLPKSVLTDDQLSDLRSILTKEITHKKK